MNYYELGSQIRKSSDSVNSNIVEGYGRSRYKNEFIRFLVFSHSSCLETKGQFDKNKSFIQWFNTRNREIYY